MKISTNYRPATPRRLAAITLAAATLALGTVRGAHAVTLEQKWHAGEQLNYDLSLKGTLSLDTDANAPFLWAGLPLDVELNGDGNLALDTKTVNPDGAGIVAMKLPRLKIAGSAWEQNILLDITDGKPSFSFNGRATDTRGGNANFLIQPPYGLQIGANGHIQKIVPLKEAAADAGAPNDAAPADQAPAGLPVNIAGLLRSAILQMFPAPWPAGDVAVGDTWTVQSRLPLPRKDAAGNDGPQDGPGFQLIDVGKFNMTLKGEEQIEGHKALRVAVDGAWTIDKAKAAIFNDALGDSARGNKLLSAVQKVSGDLWFDADAGQLVKADVVLKGQVKGIGVTPPKAGANAAPNGKPATWNSTQGFYGTLKLTLHDVTQTP